MIERGGEGERVWKDVFVPLCGVGDRVFVVHMVDRAKSAVAAGQFLGRQIFSAYFSNRISRLNLGKGSIRLNGLVADNHPSI